MQVLHSMLPCGCPDLPTYWAVPTPKNAAISSLAAFMPISTAAMRSDHFIVDGPEIRPGDENLEDVDVAVVGGGPGGLSAGVSMSIADPSLKIRVNSIPHQAG